MSRICKQTVPEMIVCQTPAFVNTLLTVTAVCCAAWRRQRRDSGKFRQASRGCSAAGADFIAPSAAMDGQVQAIVRRWTLRALKIRRLCRIRPVRLFLLWSVP